MPYQEIKVHYPHGIKGQFSIKDPFWINDSVYLDNSGDLILGAGINLSREVCVYTHDHYHYKNLKIDETVEKLGVKISNLVIEDDVYIGAKCIILSSCNKLGKGCVIGAGSIVTHDVPEYEIWCGNTARFIKKVEDYKG